MALVVKFACLALGAVGIANMYLAIFADVGVMILAVLNAIRCLFRSAGCMVTVRFRMRLKCCGNIAAV